MGGSVSSGRTNDELVDNLVESLHIKSANVEKAFRGVDRGLFYLPAYRDIAYRDLAWREGNIHISAPCIYSEVMEALKLNECGLSFLNIGSGTGYLSTMVGCLLGSYGVNHNIEIHKDVIDHAKKCVSNFVRTSAHFDAFDFCAPKFIHGNFLDINITQDTLLYDRIYVGTGVTEENIEFIKQLIKVNGIIVAPFNELLIQITRLSHTEYATKNLMSVSFANLIKDNINLNSLQMPKIQPQSLQDICRFRLRELIREAIELDYPNEYKLVMKKPKKFTKEGEDDTDEGYESYRNRIYFQNSLSDAQFRSMIQRRLLIHNYTENEEIDDDDDDDNDDQSNAIRSRRQSNTEPDDTRNTRRVSVIAVPLSNPTTTMDTYNDETSSNQSNNNNEYSLLVVEPNDTSGNIENDDSRLRLASTSSSETNNDQALEKLNGDKSTPIGIKKKENFAINHLRERILTLSIPDTIKNYLLFYRNI